MRRFRMSTERLPHSLSLRIQPIGRQQRIRISRATQETIDAVVKVVRRTVRITRISDIPKNSSLVNDASRFNVGESVKVCVVMPLPARTQDTNNMTTQAVFANFEYYTVCCAGHRTTERREDVDTFVPSIAAPRSAPRVL